MFPTDAASFWDEKYLNNEDRWDMKTPTPVFENLIVSQQFIKPGKILILGCGKGYDAILAAKKGFDVYAVDFSIEAIKFAKKMAEEENLKINFLLYDIFDLDSIYKNQFDYIYDYVTYCAINPERRKEYAAKISNLLKQNGKLVALLFPVEERGGGPPYRCGRSGILQFIFTASPIKVFIKQNQFYKTQDGEEKFSRFI